MRSRALTLLFLLSSQAFFGIAAFAASPKKLAVTPADFAQAISDAKLFDKEAKINVGINKHELIVTAYANKHSKSVFNDCKIDAVLMAKVVMTANPAITRLKARFYNQMLTKYAEVVVTTGDVIAYGSGNMSKSQLLDSLELKLIATGANSSANPSTNPSTNPAASSSTNQVANSSNNRATNSAVSGNSAAAAASAQNSGDEIFKNQDIEFPYPKALLNQNTPCHFFKAVTEQPLLQLVDGKNPLANMIAVSKFSSEKAAPKAQKDVENLTADSCKILYSAAGWVAPECPVSPYVVATDSGAVPLFVKRAYIDTTGGLYTFTLYGPVSSYQDFDKFFALFLSRIRVLKR